MSDEASNRIDPSAKSKETPRCGLCGKSEKLVRTPCCGNWICDDADKYVTFSYARNSCFRNHERFTVCGYHHSQRHEGHWKDCAKCRMEAPAELYVYHSTNEYNFEKLENPPSFEPTYCGACGVVIRLSQDSYSIRAEQYLCASCSARATGKTPNQIHATIAAATVPKHKSHGSNRNAKNYPIGTIAYYGPDNNLATKLVASVVKKPGAQPDPLHRWISHAGDVREDRSIAEEVAAFFKQHRVKQTISPGRIIGCPHEEGVDYPLGEKCPHCPFWHNRDRFTHELNDPGSAMTPGQVLAERSDAPTELAPQPRRVPAKTGRNDPCPCGSGQKYKKCCGR